MRHFITIVTIVINVLSLVALVTGVLLHSGRGGGLSDMFGGGGGAALGSAAAERNLNRMGNHGCCLRNVSRLSRPVNR